MQFWAKRAASRIGIRLRRQEGSDSSWTSWGFRGCGWLVLVFEIASVRFVGGLVFGGEDGDASRESVAESVLRRTLFTGICARAGGVLGVGAVGCGAIRVAEFESW